MPLVPNTLERLLLFRLNRGPAPLLDLVGAASLAAVRQALDMDLFEALAEAPATPAALADRLDADPEGVGVLLSFLAAQGYVVVDDGRYRNSRMTTRWLTDASGTDIGPWLTFWHDLVVPFWMEHLDHAIRAGAPPRTIYEWFDEEPSRWAVAQAGFRAAAAVSVDEVSRAVTVPPDARRLLDVGGGHGRYAVALCAANPALSATVFDTPAALEAAREEAKAVGLGDRVTVVGGDYLSDDLGADYDLALVFNVLHAHDAATARALLGRVAAALRPGGRVAVLDQFAGTARTPLGRSVLGFVDVTYLTTLGATTHPTDALTDWLHEVGFTDVRRSPVRRAGPGNTLVQARLA